MVRLDLITVFELLVKIISCLYAGAPAPAPAPAPATATATATAPSPGPAPAMVRLDLKTVFELWVKIISCLHGGAPAPAPAPAMLRLDIISVFELFVKIIFQKIWKNVKLFFFSLSSKSSFSVGNCLLCHFHTHLDKKIFFADFLLNISFSL